MVQFKAVLKPDPTGTGTYIDVPTEVIDSLHLKGRPKIQAVIAGHPYRGSLMPIGDGSYALRVLKAIQQAEGLKHGDAITVEPPADLQKLLTRDKRGAAAWERLSFTDKKEIARSLEDAKKPETRQRRLASALSKLRTSPSPPSP